MEANTSGADPPTKSQLSLAPTELEDHVGSDRLHMSEDSPSRIRTSTEVIAFVDLQAESCSHNTACINTRVDDHERKGTDERERLGMHRTAHPDCQVGGCEAPDFQRDRPPSVVDTNSDCVQPSSTTNLCDAPSQCPDVVDSSDVTLHTTNLGSNSASDDYVFYRADSHRTKWEEAAIYVQEGEDNEKFVHHPTNRHSKLAFKILHHPAYYITHLIVTILLMLLALAENYPTPRNGSQISDQAQRAIFLVSSTLELLFLMFIAVHIILKFIWYGPRKFIPSKRSLLIAIVLVVLFVEVIVLLVRQRSHLRITRTLRPIFFIDNVLMDEVRRELRDIWKSLKPIIDVLLLLIFFVLMFALLGYYILAGIDPSFFDSFQMSFISLYILMTTANNPDVMLESYLERPASVIFFAIYIIITVYFISNMLLAVVYSSFSDAAMTKFKNLYLHKRKALKLAYSILAQQNGIDFHDFQKFMKYYRPTLAGCEAMCTFKALHRDPEDTEQHRPLSREEFYRFYEVLDLTWIQVHENQLHWYKQVDLLVVKTCQTPIKVCHTIVKSKVFKFIIYLTVLTNILVLVIYTLAVDGGPSDERFQALQRIYPLSFIFTLIYCVEIILKIIGKGPHNYYRKVWNIIDSVLVFASLLLILLEANSNLIFLAAARPFKLFRLLRLNHRYYDLLWTLVYLAPKMVTIGIFLVLVYYVYAIVGVEFLNGRVFEGCCNDSWYNIRVFYTGIIDEGNTTENVSPSVDIYYLLNFDDIARSYITLFTLMIGNNWHVIMEGFSSESRFDWLVRLYFLSFNIMTLVIFEVAIAFLVEAFVYKVLSRQRHRICRKHKGPFKHCQCPEGDDQRKKVKISLVQADLDAMKQEKERNNLSTAASKLVSSLRRQRNHEHHTHPKSFVGHRLKTKGDIQLEMYRSQLNEWVQEAEELELALAERRRKASAKVPWRTLMANHLEKMYEYLTE